MFEKFCERINTSITQYSHRNMQSIIIELFQNDSRIFINIIKNDNYEDKKVKIKDPIDSFHLNFDSIIELQHHYKYFLKIFTQELGNITIKKNDKQYWVFVRGENYPGKIKEIIV